MTASSYCTLKGFLNTKAEFFLSDKKKSDVISEISTHQVNHSDLQLKKILVIK